MSILVRHAMTESPQTISPGMNAEDAAGLMKSLDVGVLPVVEDEKLVGLVTDRDLVIRVLAERKDPEAVNVGDICTRSPVTVSPDMRLSEARELMEILSLGDVAWADASRREVGEALQAVSESEKTKTMNESAERGTPQRVQHRRQT